MNYKINTYGCQMNVHESEKIASILRGLGYAEFNENIHENYDVIIFNTCCIRDTAEQKIFSHIGELKIQKKNNPNLIIGIVGCMSQQEGKIQIMREKYPHIDIILGTSNIDLLAESIVNLKENKKHTYIIDESERPEIVEGKDYYRTSGTNAWVNIMYGCDNFCTYCIVPYVRGRERSRSMLDIINEVKDLISSGYKEITLLGQNVNSYGSDNPDGPDFGTLLEELAKLSGNHRIRFMTSHPKDLNTKVIEMISKYDTLCKSIHLPIQSGSNNVLEAMNRRYTREYYLNVIKEIRSIIPDCGITTDIMVGFPGETEQDFEDTLDIVREVQFNSAFTYIYSVRKGTVAASMPQIPYAVKSERIQRLIKIQNALTKESSKDCEGKTFRVLVEGVKSIGKVSGRTDAGRQVTFEGGEDLIGEFCNVIITKTQSASLFGTIKED